MHTPGTVLNDRFGPDAWEEYITRIEAATPLVEALGITDYWSLDRYVEVLAYKQSGRLPNVGLIFPNIEIRFAIGTNRGAAVNAHLLISPEDTDHVDRARGFLAKLSFRAHNESYRCTPDDLVRLGRGHDRTVVDDDRARTIGTNQFKVTVDDLNAALEQSEWARKNILIAVAAGSGDGSSGLSKDASLAAVRTEIERTAQVILSSNPGDREFWLGRKTLSVAELMATYDGPKPCLHGSDAHALTSVCVPDEGRLTWIKGDATFESLRQACIEPESRTHIGPTPPEGALPYRAIESVELKGTDWCSPDRIELNPGLVGIIGARGSGKTALADIVATGAGSLESHENNRSFLHRASAHLANLQVKLTWCDGTRTVGGPGCEGSSPTEDSRVQYLSQQFVERLCSSDGGVTDELLSEIERVVFDQHPPQNRVGTTTFNDLLEVRASRSQLARGRSREALNRAVKQMFDERRRQAELSSLQAREIKAKQVIADDQKARLALVGDNGENRTERLNDIRSAIDVRQLQLDAANRQKQALDELRDFVADVRDRRIRSELADLTQENAAAGLTETDWTAFERVFAGDVDAILDRHVQETQRRLLEIVGAAVEDHAQDTPYLADDADLSTVPQAALIKEAERLGKLIGIDAKKAEQLQKLGQKIVREQAALTHLAGQIADAEKAAGRIQTLRDERKKEYEKIFDAFIGEEQQLADLYAPLASTLADSEGALGRLTFTVRREVDIDGWAKAGEDLLDLRTTGPFKGRGALLEAAREELLPAWRTGSSTEVAEAMSNFRDHHDKALLEHSPVPRADGQRYWEWAASVANWLDDTSHIAIRYGIQYDGVDIEQLSPGTRGIVLLLLYLSLDRNDDRPLIIDQPEENLDPKSVFDELVERFRQTRLRRQVIIVTHNANLIVNTDADQVIVASACPHRPGDLPRISYVAGGLEDPAIRQKVCEILEGGEQAFKERARRLRVGLPR